MQKVSKQSLAMIALSILLAISIALTFTFAALSDKKTATGTITFSGGVGLIYDGVTDAANIDITISYDGTNYTAKVGEKNLSDVSIKLATTSVAATINATLTNTGKQSTVIAKIVSLTQIEGTKKATDDGTALSEIIKISFDNLSAEDIVALSEAAAADRQFTVTFTASKATA